MSSALNVLIISAVLATVNVVSGQDVCPRNSFTTSVPEDTPTGTALFNFTVHPSTTWSFAVNPNIQFAKDYLTLNISGAQGSILLNRELDAEMTNPNYPEQFFREIQFLLTCSYPDPSGPRRNINYSVIVIVENVNDNYPVFIGAPYFKDISELTPVQTTIFILKDLAVDRDVGGAIMNYAIVNGGDGAFNLTGPTRDGYITVLKPLDYDRGQRIVTLNVSATDNGAMYSNSKSLTNYTTLTINILDADDQNPVFTQDSYKLAIEEETNSTDSTVSLVGKQLFTTPPIKAYDQDVGINMTINYEILKGNVIGGISYLIIDRITGAIIPLQRFDHEKVKQLVVRIKGYQTDDPVGRYAFADLVVDIIDKDDNPPVLDPLTYTRSIPENPTFGTELALLTATDADDGAFGQFYYVMIDNSGAFELNKDSGQIYVIKPEIIDREKIQKMEIQVYAQARVSSQRSDMGRVVVTIMDVNDNQPVFQPNATYTFVTLENATVGHVIGTILANDSDAGDNARVLYSVLYGSYDAALKFAVGAQNGTVYTTRSLEEPFYDEYRIQVLATDQAKLVSERRSSTALVVVNVVNQNNRPPVFTHPNYTATVSEDAVVGTTVRQVLASDPDPGSLNYLIAAGDPGGQFDIDGDGFVLVNRTLDFNEIAVYNLTVTVSDGKHVSSASLTVHVTNSNNHPPLFTRTLYSFLAVEDSTPALPIGTLTATDADGPATIISYNVISGNGDSIFSLNRTTGAFFVVNGTKLDTSVRKVYILLVQAFDDGDPMRSGFSTVEVTVVDANNKAPRFTPSIIPAAVFENQPIGKYITTLTAVDEDTVGSLTYAITAGNDANFNLSATTGELFTTAVLDRETQDRYLVNVTVSDGPHQAYGLVNITVLDANDQAPVFYPTAYTAFIAQNAAINRTLVTVNATDGDIGNNQLLTFWLTYTDGVFTIDHQTGLVRLVSSLNQTNKNRYDMLVFAADHGSPPLFGNATITVYVNNTNAHAPVFNKFAYDVTISEDAKAGTVLLTITATDVDEGLAGKVTLAIVEGDTKQFRLAKDGSLVLISGLDYEKNEFYELKVRATDQSADPMSTDATVRVTVTDVNDQVPKFMPLPDRLLLLSTTAAATTVYRASATDADSDTDSNNKMTYSLLNERETFAISPTTGIITVVKTTALDVRSYTLQLSVTDQGTPALSSATELLVVVLESNDMIGVPRFEQNPFTASVAENTAIPAAVVDIQAQLYGRGLDNDLGIQYNLTEPDGTDTFSIGKSDGKISMRRQVDRELTPFRFLLVTAYNQFDYSKSANSGVMVTIRDVQDVAPRFPFGQYDCTVKENRPIGSTVLALSAKDTDENPVLTYTLLTESSGQNLFAVKSQDNSAIIIVNKALDVDFLPPGQTGTYFLKIQVSDGKFTNATTVSIRVDDVNDNFPQFLDKAMYRTTLREDIGPGYEVMQISAEDADKIDQGKLTYYIMTGDTDFRFNINHQSGVIYRSLNNSLDREKTDDYTLKVLVNDTAGNSNMTNVYILVDDINDSTPTFLDGPYVMEVVEGPASRGKKLEMAVDDADLGDNGDVMFSIIKGNETGDFGITKVHNDVTVTILNGLDRERPGLEIAENGTAFYRIIVQAMDKGVPPMSATATVTFVVYDINDQPPKFERDQYVAPLSEGSPLGFPLMTVTATDPDLPSNTVLTYSIVGGNVNDTFTIDPKTGVVSLSNYPDLSALKLYNISLLVSDGLFNATALLTVQVMDVNDNDPTFAQTIYQFTTPENDQSGGAWGVFVGRVVATDRDEGSNGQVGYRITSSNAAGRFNITQEGNISTAAILDRETTARYFIVVTAEDKGRPSRRGTCEVEISILDVNDNRPTFLNAPYNGTVDEQSSVGTVVTMPKIEVFDADVGENAKVIYELSGDQKDFIVDRNTGVVTVANGSLDRETRDMYVLGLVIRDAGGGAGSLNGSTTLTIRLNDINDNAPTFSQRAYSFNVSESATSNSAVGNVAASDVDVDVNARVQYALVSGHDGKFYIDRLTGYIYVTGGLDRETTSAYTLNVSALDGGLRPGPLESFVTVTITLLDVNDNSPAFNTTLIRTNVDEASAPPVPVAMVHAVDPDLGSNGTVSYFMNDTVPFAVDTSGRITTTTKLDREERILYSFYVYARDAATPPRTGSTEIVVQVNDVNDHAPTFEEANYTVNILEKSPPNSVLLWPRVTDGDSASNANFTFSIQGNGSEYFSIDAKSGLVRIAKTIDKSTLIRRGLIGDGVLDAPDNSTMVLMIVCNDNGSPPLTGNARLLVRVDDVSDDTPVFSQPSYEVTIKEEVAKGTSVITVKATVQESGTDLRYAFINANLFFTIDEKTGAITTTGERLDREAAGYFSFTVRVTTANRTPEKFAYAVVTVTLQDVNDNRPIFDQILVQISLDEGVCTDRKLADIVARDADTGDNAKVSYSITFGNTDDVFAIGPITGAFTCVKSLDREKLDSYMIVIQAADQGSPVLVSTMVVQVTVLDVNDNVPTFIGAPYNAAVDENQAPGIEVVRVRATDADVGLNGKVFYSINDVDMSSLFYIDNANATGVIRTLKSMDYEQTSKYTLTVTAYDLGQPPLNSTTVVYIQVNNLNDNKPVFSQPIYAVAVPDNATVGLVVHQLSAGSGVYTYTITGGNGTGAFGIDGSTGRLRVVSKLDARQQSLYSIQVKATDDQIPPASATTQVDFIISDTSPIPSFAQSQFAIVYNENQPPPQLLVDLTSSDEERGRQVKYTIVQGNVNGSFRLEEASGKLYCDKVLDRERVGVYVIRVRAERPSTANSGRRKRDTVLTYNEVDVTVNVGDVNDNKPVFEKKLYIAAVPADASFDHPVIKVKATDADTKDVLQYSILPGDFSGYYFVNASTGLITSNVNFVLVKQREFTLNIQVNDGGTGDDHTDTSQVSITVLADSQQTILVANLSTPEFRLNQDEIARKLSEILGFDVRAEKIEPHVQDKGTSNKVDETRTDMYFYAVNPLRNTIVKKENLKDRIEEKHEQIEALFRQYRLEKFEYVPVKSSVYVLQSAEIALLLLAVVIIVGSIIGILIIVYLTWRSNIMTFVDGSMLETQEVTLDFGQPTESTDDVSYNGSPARKQAPPTIEEILVQNRVAANQKAENIFREAAADTLDLLDSDPEDDQLVNTISDGGVRPIAYHGAMDNMVDELVTWL